MRRYKLFLGVTTCLLAIAGVVATKAARLGIGATRYYCTSRNLFAYCLPKFSICTNYGIGVLTCHFSIRVGDQRTFFYTLYSDGQASAPYFHCGMPGVCSFPVKYLQEY